MTARYESAIVSRIRWSGALASVAALVALIAIGPPGSARAATSSGTGYDQITGAGTTNSAITVPWTQGLLDNTNKPIAAANADRSSANPTSLWSFMYPDFKNLKITVSQTQDITHQGVTVTWTGGQPTNLYDGRPATDFLQLMECYGDASSGPSPQACEFGDGSMLGTGAPNGTIGTRQGALCAVDPTTGKTLPPSTSNPPRSLDNSGPQQGCDPAEPLAGASPPDTDPNDAQSYTVPFVPVSAPSSPAYSQSDISQYFNGFNTNEVQEAVTNPDGTGLVHFETLTNTEAPGLGCGQLESNHQPRNCWLVIVPRGTFEPNGFLTSPATQGTAFIYSSPLSASNWAMRIQIHLAYAPIQSFCPIGTQETETVGTQIVSRAVQSWQLALNQAAKCATIYGYSAVPEATSTQQLSLAGSGVGLAFTTIPIGSEAARAGGSGGTANLPPLLYAPIAVSAEGFGFNINGRTGYINTPVHLSPDLLAKGLTQVYLTDLPDYYPAADGHPGPAWAANANQTNISEDPEFKLLNPGVPPVSPQYSLAPLLTEDHSALNQQIWQWIQGDSAASAWLNQGTSNGANAVVADPDYTALKLGTPPAIDSFPRAYTGVLDLGQSNTQPPKEETKTSIDLLPYVNNYDEAATDVLTANNTTSGQWDNFATGPDGSVGWWDKNGAEPIGQTFIWGLSDTPDLAAYGLIGAQLCSDSGTNCIAPSTASLTTALNSAKADSAGLLEVDPAKPGTGGYPLTVVTYAAVATNQSAAALTAYAKLIAYAAGTGQTPGVAPGDLPPGYLPLPANLKAQAKAVVSKLLADAKALTSPSPSPTSTTPSSSTSGATTPAVSAGTGSASSGSGQLAPAVSTATPVTGLSINPPSAELASTRTGRQPVGAIRWALLVIVLAGAACAAGGTALRSASVAAWLRRMRP
jgi:hypothetical protein